MCRIFLAESKQEARVAFRRLAEKLEGKTDKALEILEHGLEGALAVMNLPEKYHWRLASTNMQERLRTGSRFLLRQCILLGPF